MKKSEAIAIINKILERKPEHWVVKLCLWLKENQDSDLLPFLDESL